MSRNLVIRALFVALGGVALSALAALVAPGSTIASKLIGTSVVLGLLCLLLLPIARRWEHGSWTPLARAYVVVVPTAAGLGVAAIWWEAVFGPSLWIEWRLAWLASLLMAWMLLAALPLRLLTVDRTRRPARVTLLAVSAAFVWWSLAIFELVSSGDDGGRGWVLLLAAPVYGALSLPIPPTVERSVWRAFRWIGVAAAIGATGILLVELPWTWTPGPVLEHWTLVVGLAATAVTVAAGVALESAKGPPWRQWVHRVTVGMLALEGALLTIMVDASLLVGDRWETALVSLGILTLVGLATSVVLDAAGRAAERAKGAVAALSEVRLACPRCGRSQSLPLGTATACGRCGLVIEVTVRQDQCLACGYSRTGLAPSTACPECGAAGAAEVNAGPN
jgi:hypothetical protein